MTDRINDNIGEFQRIERGNARVLIGMSIVLAFFLASISYHFILLSKKDELIRDLSNNRIMYGILSDDGRYFQAVKDIPNNIIRDFTRSFIVDWANYTPVTIKENRNSAFKKLDIDFKKNIKRNADIETKVLSTKLFSQQFIPTTYEMTVNPDNDRMMDITITGAIKQWQNDKLVTENPRGSTVEYTITVKKQVPTESNPQGLSVVDLVQPKLTEIK